MNRHHRRRAVACAGVVAAPARADVLDITGAAGPVH
jgi:hypothetical protein